MTPQTCTHGASVGKPSHTGSNRTPLRRCHGSSCRAPPMVRWWTTSVLHFRLRPYHLSCIAGYGHVEVMHINPDISKSKRGAPMTLAEYVTCGITRPRPWPQQCSPMTRSTVLPEAAWQTRGTLPRHGWRECCLDVANPLAGDPLLHATPNSHMKRGTLAGWRKCCLVDDRNRLAGAPSLYTTPTSHANMSTLTQMA